MKLFPYEFWIAVQLIIDFIFIAILFFFIRNMKNGIRNNVIREASTKVLEIIEPALKETGVLEHKFGDQLREKKLIVSDLNRRLDDKIISLNLLLKRTDEYFKQKSPASEPERAQSVKSEHVQTMNADIQIQQEMVVELYRDGFDVNYIAKRVKMSESEVRLVIDLKKRFNNMEKNS